VVRPTLVWWCCGRGRGAWSVATSEAAAGDQPECRRPGLPSGRWQGLTLKDTAPHSALLMISIDTHTHWCTPLSVHTHTHTHTGVRSATCTHILVYRTDKMVIL